MGGDILIDALLGGEVRVEISSQFAFVHEVHPESMCPIMASICRRGQVHTRCPLWRGKGQLRLR